MPALIERQKMSLTMWAALKNHIMLQREKKKQELEADAAIERHRREQELKRKQDAMTLEEIKEQVSQSEKRLKQLKDEKHQLFLQLKKVLNEDDAKRRALIKEATEQYNAAMQSHHENVLKQQAQAASAAQHLVPTPHLPHDRVQRPPVAFIQDPNRSIYKMPLHQPTPLLHGRPALKQPQPQRQVITSDSQYPSAFKSNVSQASAMQMANTVSYGHKLVHPTATTPVFATAPHSMYFQAAAPGNSGGPPTMSVPYPGYPPPGLAFSTPDGKPIVYHPQAGFPPGAAPPAMVAIVPGGNDSRQGSQPSPAGGNSRGISPKPPASRASPHYHAAVLAAKMQHQQQAAAAAAQHHHNMQVALHQQRAAVAQYHAAVAHMTPPPPGAQQQQQQGPNSNPAQMPPTSRYY